MAKNVDPEFYDRADAHISLANEQAATIERGKVSASMMYATARYNAFISASRSGSSQDLAAGKGEILDYFVEEYRKMLAENLDDQIENFSKYRE